MRKTASWSGSLRPTEYKVAARMFISDGVAPLDGIITDHNEGLHARLLEACSLETPNPPGRGLSRRPDLTAPAADSTWMCGSGRRAGLSNRTKKLG